MCASVHMCACVNRSMCLSGCMWHMCVCVCVCEWAYMCILNLDPTNGNRWPALTWFGNVKLLKGVWTQHHLGAELQNSCLECCLPPWLIAAGLDLLTIPGGVSSQARTCSRAGGRKFSSPCLLWHSWNLAGKKSVLLKRTDSVGLRQSRSASPSRPSPGTPSCVTLSFVLKLLCTFRCIAFPLPANNPEAHPLFFPGFCEMWSFKQHDG